MIHPLPGNWVLWSRLRGGYKWTQRLDQIEQAEAHWIGNMHTRSITERHGKSIVIDGMYGTLGRSTVERTEKYAEVENMILGLAKAA